MLDVSLILQTAQQTFQQAPQQASSSAKDVASYLALVVSLFTLYWTIFRKGKLKARLGRVILLQYVTNGRTHFKPEISVVNSGANTAVVYNISGWIRRLSDDRKENLTWTENLKTDFDPVNRSNDTRFDSFPDAIVVAKFEAIKQRLLMTTEHPYELQPGDYEISLVIDSDGASQKQITVSNKIRIRPDDRSFLEQARPAPDAMKGQNLRFVMEYGPNTNCYISTAR